MPTPGPGDGLAAGNIVIDTPPPTVTSVSTALGSGTYGAGVQIDIAVDLSDAVNVTGTPELALNAGGGAVAVYTSGSGTDELDFTYTVAVGQATPDLDYASTTALSLNGGAINDVQSGLAATLTLAAPGPSDGLTAAHIVIDTPPPTVTDLWSGASAGTYGAGYQIWIAVDFSDAVNVTGTPELALNDGAVAAYRNGSGTDQLNFFYTVAVGQVTADLDYASTTALALNGGTIMDATSGLPATLTLPAPGPSDGLEAAHIVIDTPAPTVTGVSSSWYGPNGTGQKIPITVTFSDNVYVTGTPQLALNAGGGAVAVYSSGNRADTLTFTYTVAAGQSTPDLNYASTTALSLNGGTIVDASSGLPATLTLPAPGPSDGLAGNFLIINTTPPTVTGVSTTQPTGFYRAAARVPINVTFSEPVNVYGAAPELMLNDGDSAYYSYGSGTTTLTFYYDVESGDNTPDLDYASTARCFFGAAAESPTRHTTRPCSPCRLRAAMAWQPRTSSSTRRRRRS